MQNTATTNLKDKNKEDKDNIDNKNLKNKQVFNSHKQLEVVTNLNIDKASKSDKLQIIENIIDQQIPLTTRQKKDLSSKFKEKHDKKASISLSSQHLPNLSVNLKEDLKIPNGGKLHKRTNSSNHDLV